MSYPFGSLISYREGASYMGDAELCPVVLFPGRFHVDPEPPEYCDNEVAPGHKVCSLHEEGGYDDEG